MIVHNLTSGKLNKDRQTLVQKIARHPSDLIADVSRDKPQKYSKPLEFALYWPTTVEAKPEFNSCEH